MEASPALPSRKRTRIATSCKNCRVRHLQCDLTLPTCRRCEVQGVECSRTINLKFRHGLSDGKTLETMFPASQSWIGPRFPLQFYDETSQLKKLYGDLFFERNAPPGTMINITQNSHLVTSSQQPENVSPSPSAVSQGCHDETNVVTLEAKGFHAKHSFDNAEEGLHSLTETPTTTLTNTNNDATIIPPQSISASVSSHRDFGVVSTAYQDHIEPLTGREAELMRNFTENIALWADATDAERHFEIDIPMRALSNTMLRYAIFSFSSRHINRGIHQFDSEEALEYRNKALQLLIPQLSGPVEDLTDEHLAAVVILRLDEEFDLQDARSHLVGATRIVNLMASFSSSGGLGEACAWLCLRQDIHISIVSQQPLQTNLANFRNARWLMRDDDISWANRITLLLATILSWAFRDRSEARTTALKLLSDEVDEWDQTKPLSFRAIRNVPHGEERGRRLPVIWMLSPFHVHGVQCYHIAKILLLLSTEPDARGNYGIHIYQQSREVEKALREHLLVILGLAISNPRAENTLFQARHALITWGGVFRDQLDQEAVTLFLQGMQDKTGWDVSKTLETLHGLWRTWP